MNQGAMDILSSDTARPATSQKVKDNHCMYHIKSYTSGPHHLHQNYAEHCIRYIKDVPNCILTFTGTPSNLWLLCLMYDVYILNITDNSSIHNISPSQQLYSQPPDISTALSFQFYVPVFFSDTNSH